LALLDLAPLSHASQDENDKTPVKVVREKAADTAEAIKNYSVDKRDEAAKRAKAALDVLDTRINALEERIDKNWEKMDNAARGQARITLKALHKRRVEAAEWYGGLKNSTAHAWEHVKDGFSDSYKSLRSASEKAERDYEDYQKK
jgi:hypothetical protein